MQRCPIPSDHLLPVAAGEFLYGPEQLTCTSDAFWIARYPVTNATFAAFIAADGYQEARWWSTAGNEWRQRQNWQAPNEWQEEQWNTPEQPVVGVSWYEAEAFCQWLDACYRQEQWPIPAASPQSYQLRLPTEQEWEHAARGEDGRRYPWGITENHEHANMGRNSQGQTTPVTQHPAGASPVGALDMVGNVWEWTLASEGEKRVTRGGSWFDLPEVANCSGRGTLNPEQRSFPMWGFRVVLAPTL